MTNPVALGQADRASVIYLLQSWTGHHLNAYKGQQHFAQAGDTLPINGTNSLAAEQFYQNIKNVPWAHHSASLAPG